MPPYKEKPPAQADDFSKSLLIVLLFPYSLTELDVRLLQFFQRTTHHIFGALHSVLAVFTGGTTLGLHLRHFDDLTEDVLAVCEYREGSKCETMQVNANPSGVCVVCAMLV